MKRAISLIMTVVMAFIFTGCEANVSEFQELSYDSIIIESAEFISEQKNPTSANPFNSDTYKFSVNKNGDEYSINFNGDVEKIRVSTKTEGEEKVYIPKDIKQIKNKETLKMIESSKKKVIDYIKKSRLLQNKEELIEKISGLEAYIAELTDEDFIVAIWDYRDEKIYVEKDNIKNASEWMFVHEMIHALSFYTHGANIDEQPYAFSLFNETFTDLITSAIQYGSNDIRVSGYAGNFEWIFPFVNDFGLDAIEAYFYGYDEIVDKIGSQNELDLFIMAFDRVIICDRFAIVLYNHFIYKWQIV